MENAWRLLDEPEASAGFNERLARIEIRSCGPGAAMARIATSAADANAMGGLHGGFLAAVGEQCLCVPLYLDGRISRAGCVAVDYAMKYLAGGAAGVALEVEITTLRETGRLGFISGMMRQNGELIAMFSGTLRKLPRG